MKHKSNSRASLQPKDQCKMPIKDLLKMKVGDYRLANKKYEDPKQLDMDRAYEDKNRAVMGENEAKKIR
jgi:hypothetical protein